MRTSSAGSAAVLLGIVLGTSGCLGSKPTPGPQPEPRRGGTLTVLEVEPDSIDPAQTGGVAFPIVYATQRPLYRRADDADGIVPDLAAGEPEVSEDGRTLTVRLRDGVRFSPPVGREVTSRDVRYAIERGFTPQIRTPYAPVYFGQIAGVDAFTASRAAHIAGIETPDARTIRFRLKSPSARVLAGALSLPLSAPVPSEYARRFDRQTPPQYGRHQVATGPYMIANDGSGRITGYRRGRDMRLVRNPSWRPETDDRPAYVDQILLRFGDEPAVAARRVLRGSGMMTGVDLTAPTQLARAAREGDLRQIAYEPSPIGQVRFLTLNTQVPPLDDINVRRAVIAAMDRQAVLNAGGGRAFGEVATHILTPGVPGFQQAGGRRGPGFDYLAHPQGDLRLAAHYLRRAGYPDGRYSGRHRLRMMAANTPTDQAMAEAAHVQLQRIGLRVDLRVLDFDIAYGRYCARPSTRTPLCMAVWFKDFNDGASAIDPLFAGDRINPEFNTNLSLLDEPDVDAAIARARAENDPAARAEAWARVDRLVMKHAAAVPLVWDRGARLHSADVRVAGDWTVALAYSSVAR